MIDTEVTQPLSPGMATAILVADPDVICREKPHPYSYMPILEFRLDDEWVQVSSAAYLNDRFRSQLSLRYERAMKNQ